MIARLIPLLFTFAGLTGCVLGSPEQLLTPPPLMSGQGQQTGQFPAIGSQPQGQTSQITPDEAAAAKAKLKQDVAPAQQQAINNDQARYLAEVKALQELAAKQRAKRQADIESRQF